MVLFEFGSEIFSHLLVNVLLLLRCPPLGFEDRTLALSQNLLDFHVGNYIVHRSSLVDYFVHFCGRVYFLLAVHSAGDGTVAIRLYFLKTAQALFRAKLPHQFFSSFDVFDHFEVDALEVISTFAIILLIDIVFLL